MMRILSTGIILLGLAFLAIGCSGDRRFAVTGVVRAPLDGDQLIVEHDEIPGFMPAMTMAFTVADPAAARELREGDQITFDFRVGETRSVAERIRVTGRESVKRIQVTAVAPVSRLRVGDRVPAFALVDDRGEPLTEADWQGKLTLVTFIFTRCPVPEYCPAMALRFGEIQNQVLADATLRANVRLYGVTLDPEFDQPEILRAYGEAVGAREGTWHFATGATSEIAKLTRAFAVYTERNGVTLDHTLTTALIGVDGTVLELWRGNGWKTEEVLATMRQTRVAAAEVAARTP